MVCLLIYPNFQSISLAIGTVFEYANFLSGKKVYDFKVVSEHGGSVLSSLGFSINTSRLNLAACDTLIVSGDNECRLPSNGLLSALKQAETSASRIASICTGSFVLAEAGLLDAKRATTYWVHADQFRSRYPKVRLEDDRIYVVDGQIWTSAGMTAGLDLALAMVEHDLNAKIARQIAKHIIVYHRRGGAHSQLSAMLDLDARSDRIQKAFTYAKENLNSDLSADALAHVVNMSPRQFCRVFKKETGNPPAKAIEKLRVETARFMLETGNHPVGVIAKDTGFGNLERMRQAFLRAYGQSPLMIRRLS